MDYMTLCKYTDNKKLYTLDDIIANFIDLDWFLKHVITDIKINQFYAHYNYYF